MMIVDILLQHFVLAKIIKVSIEVTDIGLVEIAVVNRSFDKAFKMTNALI